jgi:hypothetical protein
VNFSFCTESYLLMSQLEGKVQNDTFTIRGLECGQQMKPHFHCFQCTHKGIELERYHFLALVVLKTITAGRLSKSSHV